MSKLLIALVMVLGMVLSACSYKETKTVNQPVTADQPPAQTTTTTTKLGF